MVDGMLTPCSGGMLLMPVKRGALSTEYWPAGLVIWVFTPNEPNWEKVSTIPSPKWSKNNPNPPRTVVLVSGEYATARRGAMLFRCMFQYGLRPCAWPDGENARSGWSLWPRAACM